MVPSILSKNKQIKYLSTYAMIPQVELRIPKSFFEINRSLCTISSESLFSNYAINIKLCCVFLYVVWKKQPKQGHCWQDFTYLQHFWESLDWVWHFSRLLDRTRFGVSTDECRKILLSKCTGPLQMGTMLKRKSLRITGLAFLFPLKWIFKNIYLYL